MLSSLSIPLAEHSLVFVRYLIAFIVLMFVSRAAILPLLDQTFDSRHLEDKENEDLELLFYHEYK